MKTERNKRRGNTPSLWTIKKKEKRILECGFLHFVSPRPLDVESAPNELRFSIALTRCCCCFVSILLLFFLVIMSMTLPRLVVGRYGQEGLSVPPLSLVPPKSAPVVESDNRNRSDQSVFNYCSKTLSRSDTKVTLRRRGSNSINRKNRNSLALVGGTVRENGDYFKELLSDADYLCTTYRRDIAIRSLTKCLEF